MAHPSIKGLPPIHPGDYLKDMLPELDITTQGFAEHIGVGRQTLYDLMAGKRPVTAGMALRLAKAIGGSAEFWMNLQSIHDLKVAEQELEAELAGIRKVSRIAAAAGTATGSGTVKARGAGVIQGGKVDAAMVKGSVKGGELKFTKTRAAAKGAFTHPVSFTHGRAIRGKVAPKKKA